MSEERAEDRARVVIRPPILLLLCLLAGLGGHAVLPLAFVPGVLAAPIGAALVVASVGLFVWAVRTMLRAGQSLPTHEPTTAIVRAGPYGRMRNPIYLSFCGLQLGIAVWLNGVALLASAAVCFWVLRKGVVEREEAYLAAKFGEPYRAYQREVRRWL